MNKSFKVVFSKARSALMVVNEATSSIQAKGTKTVIAAAAAAMIAGGAVAAQPVEAQATDVYIGTGVTHSLVGTTTTSKGNQSWDTTQKVWKTAAQDAPLATASTVILDGTLNVGVQLKEGGTAEAGAELSIASLKSTGIVNITAGNAAATGASGAAVKATGAVDLLGGELNFLANPNATTKAAAASADGSTKAKTYGALSLESTSGNVTLGQTATTDQAASVLAVKVDKDISATIKGANVNVTNATFANEGALTIQATGSTNPTVKFASDYTQGTGNSGKLDVIGASEFTGNVKFDSVKVGADRTSANAATNVVSESVLLNGNVTVKGTAKKAASFATGKLNITSGTFTVGGYATADLGEVAVSGADTSLVVSDSGAATASKMTVSQGKLTVDGDLTVNKAADTPAVAAATDPVYDLTIGTAGNTVSGSLTAGSVLIGTATNAALTVSGTMQADSVTVQGDTGAAGLTVSGAKSSATIGVLNLNKSGTVSVGNSGAVVVTGDTVFAKDSMGDFTVNGTGAKVSLQNVTFAKDATGTNKVHVQNGSVTIDGTLTANAGSLTVDGATAAATVNGKVAAAGATKAGLVVLTNSGTLTLGSAADIGTEANVVTLTKGTLEATSALLTANLATGTAEEQKTKINKALNIATKADVSVTVTDEKLSSDQIIDLQKRIEANASGAAFDVTAITDSTGKEYTELFLRADKTSGASFNISDLKGDVHLKNIDAKVNENQKTTLVSDLTVGTGGFEHNLGVQSLIFETTAPSTGATNAKVTVDGKMLTLYGSLTDTAKELIQAYEYTDTTSKKVVPTAVTVQNGGKFVLGDDTAGAAQRYGNLNAEVTLTSGSMTVNNGVFTVKSLKTTANGSASVAENANLTLKSLAGEAGAVTVYGNGGCKIFCVQAIIALP